SRASRLVRIHSPAPGVNSREMTTGTVRQLDVTTAHHAASGLEKLIDAIGGVGRRVAPRKRCDGFRRHVAVHVRACTEHGAGRQTQTDASFHMIAKQRTEELHAGIPYTTRRPERHAAVRVLEIARDRTSAEVHPPAKIGMADEAVVSLVRIPKHDATAQLTAHLAHRADGASGDVAAHDGARAAD